MQYFFKKMFVSELKTCFDLPRQCCAQNCLSTTLPRSLRQRGSLATLRNRRPSARCVTVARWGGLGPPLSSHGRLLLGNLCKFGRGPHRCVLNSGFCAAAMCLRQPFNITSASYHQALEHCQAQKALNTIMFNPPKYKIHYTPSEMCGIQSFK